MYAQNTFGCADLLLGPCADCEGRTAASASGVENTISAGKYQVSTMLLKFGEEAENEYDTHMDHPAWPHDTR